MAVKRVVVEIHFAIQRQQFTIIGYYEWIDFNQRSICVDKKLIEFLEHIYRLFYQVYVIKKFECNFTSHERCHPQIGVDIELVNGVRIFFGDLFNFNTAFSTGHEDN
ncbi:hypothetical protein SDC9_183611 [bioreactor metagenome]|uniref:Uncharacterized protein n=1 Tax=bioreactor metagenome TaxID=1076179 RepID=A0A645HC61_9ZZZZ